MHLPEILEARRGMNGLHRFRVAPFASTVIHDSDARMKCVYDDGRIGTRYPVVQTQQEIDGPNRIIRAHQLKFLVLGQIT